MLSTKSIASTLVVGAVRLKCAFSAVMDTGTRTLRHFSADTAATVTPKVKIAVRESIAMLLGLSLLGSLRVKRGEDDDLGKQTQSTELRGHYIERLRWSMTEHHIIQYLLPNTRYV